MPTRPTLSIASAKAVGVVYTPPMGPPTRRSFLGGLAALAAAPGLEAAPRLPLAFSTLGCPAWSLDRILDEATRLGYAAVELRGLQGQMDLTKRPEFQGQAVSETRDRVASRGLAISDLGASARMHEPEAAARAAQLDEGRRFIDLAAALRVPYVRVFPDKLVPGEPREKTVARIVEGLATLADHARGTGVAVILESHGDFTRSTELREIVTAVGRAEVALLWDTHHTFVMSGEAPAESWGILGPFVRHVHLKDSRPEKDGRRYVLTGEGEVPVREIVRVLAAAGYRGFYSLEWEKAWHPEIEEPEVAFPHFARTMAGYLA